MGCGGGQLASGRLPSLPVARPSAIASDRPLSRPPASLVYILLLEPPFCLRVWRLSSATGVFPMAGGRDPQAEGTTGLLFTPSALGCAPVPAGGGAAAAAAARHARAHRRGRWALWEACAPHPPDSTARSGVAATASSSDPFPRPRRQPPPLWPMTIGTGPGWIISAIVASPAQCTSTRLGADWSRPRPRPRSTLAVCNNQTCTRARGKVGRPMPDGGWDARAPAEPQVAKQTRFRSGDREAAHHLWERPVFARTAATRLPVTAVASESSRPTRPTRKPLCYFRCAPPPPPAWRPSHIHQRAQWGATPASTGEIRAEIFSLGDMVTVNSGSTVRPRDLHVPERSVWPLPLSSGYNRQQNAHPRASRAVYWQAVAASPPAQPLVCAGGSPSTGLSSSPPPMGPPVLASAVVSAREWAAAATYA